MESRQDKNFREAIRGVGVYISFSILGPILCFGLLGIFLDKKFKTSPKILIVLIAIAFVLSNLMLIRKYRLLKNKLEDKN